MSIRTRHNQRSKRRKERIKFFYNAFKDMFPVTYKPDEVYQYISTFSKGYYNYQTYNKDTKDYAIGYYMFYAERSIEQFKQYVKYRI